MISRNSVFLTLASIALAVAVKVASPQRVSAAPEQPKIEARVAPLLKISGQTFKDLNRNGVLDPYEDWRQPVDRRVADLISRMTLEERSEERRVRKEGTEQW